MPKPYLRSSGLLTFAHRGGAACWPENTLEAFKGGIAAGCRWIETDVHMTRDGHIVCLHDHGLERTTEGRGMVWDYTLAELRRFDAGYRFSPEGGGHPQRGRGLTIPTLDEVLALDPEVRVNLEIKQAEPSMSAALWRHIDEAGLHDRVLVASERDDLVRGFRNLARGMVATSAGKREILAFWLAVRSGLIDWLPIEYEALQVPIRHRGLQVVDAAFVEAAHRRGVQVHVWTIDEPATMRWLIELGVDGIMTDQPHRLAGVARELGFT
ncbi:glycerophosphodiester phosphodiesterase [Nannocystaceae bacterium ST9]